MHNPQKHTSKYGDQVYYFDACKGVKKQHNKILDREDSQREGMHGESGQCMELCLEDDCSGRNTID